MGANLASIHSAGEYKFIQDLILSNTGGYTYAWIGGCDAAKVEYIIFVTNVTWILTRVAVGPMTLIHIKHDNNIGQGPGVCDLNQGFPHFSACDP